MCHTLRCFARFALQRLAHKESLLWDSNPRPPAYWAGALPGFLSVEVIATAPPWNDAECVRGTLCTFGLELFDSLSSRCKATHLQQLFQLQVFFSGLLWVCGQWIPQLKAWFGASELHSWKLGLGLGPVNSTVQRMPRPGIEPGTFRSSVWRSPNWAIAALKSDSCKSLLNHHFCLM